VHRIGVPAGVCSTAGTSEEFRSMTAFLLSFSLIFVAELGDKSQLVALWFATRYKWWLVITGVTVATLVVHLLSVAIGASVGELLPEWLVLLIVGISFIVFAAWGIRGDTMDEDDVEDSRFARFGNFGVVTISFFLAEFGDKTQLATISLGSNHSFIGVWLGSTAGMVVADGLAIAVGMAMGKHLPQRAIAIGAAVLFVAFGLIAIGRAISLVA
jgi:putative Ca2+/H+ antiporter (TMEM165/GDT1 family)